MFGIHVYFMEAQMLSGDVSGSMSSFKVKCMSNIHVGEMTNFNIGP